MRSRHLKPPFEAGEVTRFKDGGLRATGRLPVIKVGTIVHRLGNNPIFGSNLAIVPLCISIGGNFVRNVIFDELLRVDRWPPIKVNQIHRHARVNLVIQ